jgi:insulysin
MWEPRLRKFDPARIEEGLACLRPDNFRMTVVSQKFPGVWEKREKWYGTEYTYEKIPADFLAEIKKAGTSTSKNRLSELHLPHANQFIPTKLEVEKKDVKEPAVAPKLIRNDDLVRTWYKKGKVFYIASNCQIAANESSNQMIPSGFQRPIFSSTVGIRSQTLPRRIL